MAEKICRSTFLACPVGDFFKTHANLGHSNQGHCLKWRPWYIGHHHRCSAATVDFILGRPNFKGSYFPAFSLACNWTKNSSRHWRKREVHPCLFHTLGRYFGQPYPSTGDNDPSRSQNKMMPSLICKTCVVSFKKGYLFPNQLARQANNTNEMLGKLLRFRMVRGVARTRLINSRIWVSIDHHLFFSPGSNFIHNPRPKSARSLFFRGLSSLTGPN